MPRPITKKERALDEIERHKARLRKYPTEKLRWFLANGHTTDATKEVTAALRQVLSEREAVEQPPDLKDTKRD